MRNSIKSLAAVALVALAAGCTSGNAGQVPPFTSANLSANALQFAVGTATYPSGAGSHVGLNTVATWRQPNGLSGTLLSTPTITGPAGFVVPAASDANTDAGTNHISASPQCVTGVTCTPILTTFGQSGGVFAYGFAPDNSTTSGAVNFAMYGQGAGQPFYNSAAKIGFAYIGGPPAYPNVQTGTYPSGFVGFTQGFVYFDYGTTALPTGNYTLTVNIPAGNHAPFTTSAVGTLTTAAGLPAFAAPTFVSDGLGGGAGTVVVPAGCTEVVVDITDTNVGTYYTVLVTGSGTQAYVLPDNLGPQSPKIPTSPSIPVGDGYSVVAVGADYPLFEAGPPGNTSEKPTIVGANGQADVTISPVVSGTE